MHYVIIVLVILIILYLQIKVYRDTHSRLISFGSIFPDDMGEKYQIDKNGIILERETEESLKEQIGLLDKQIEKAESRAESRDYISELRNERGDLVYKLHDLHDATVNSVWDRILKSINRYLEKNKGSVSDFGLIKDIVDRNCDAEEDTIQTQVPMPLYYGLMGTMAGIIVGVGYLLLSRGLKALLDSGEAATTDAANGIEALLGGVALAMICSIVGIILTTRGSSKLKDVKVKVEERKHKFLSWMQAELLPKLNNDFADVMRKVTSNLTRFNREFSSNSDKLSDTLRVVNQATDGQARLLASIENLKIAKIATANIEVYEKLKGCTDEIGLIGEELRDSRAYLEAVRAMNEKLDASEQRTQAIEDMAYFFKEERGKIGAMQSVLNQAIGEIQTNLQKSIESLKEVSEKQISELVAHSTEQRQHLQAAIDEQDKVLQQKTAEINRLVSNLTSVEKMVQSLDTSARKQSQAISNLSQDIRDLATQKTSGTITVKQEKLPKWAKILLIIGGAVVTAYCLLSLVIRLFRLFNIL